MLKLFQSGILGMNGRNLLYVKPLNNKDAIRFADDKIKTKNFLSARNIPVPRLINKIQSTKELGSFQIKNLPDSFVIKPNAGFGGEGIIVIDKKEGNTWISKGGERYKEKDLKEHIEYILRGEYAINSLPDIAIIEQKIVCHRDIEVLGKHGLPDVRIIVYNLVPVMAMLRVPTKESQGKANLHAGAVGLGIDLAKGETTFGAHKNKNITLLPKTDIPIKGIKIPYWDEILLIAAKIQTISTLGYLAVDIAVDKDGPMLLEINARAGLAVQNANREGLRGRLERIKKTKVISPEKGVRLAQDLFGHKVEKEVSKHLGKQIIGLETEVELNLKHGTKSIFARIDTSSDKNILDKKIYKQIEKEDKSIILDFTIKGTRSRGVFTAGEMPDDKYHAIIGGKILNKFLIDPTQKEPTKKQATTRSKEDLENADSTICEIDKKLSLLTAIKPTNAAEEKIKFLSDSTYSPRFIYNYKAYPLDNYRTKLRNLKLDDSPLGTLLAHKRNEVLGKIDVIDAIGNDKKFTSAVVQLFGKPGKKLVEDAETLLRNYKKPSSKGDLFDANELKKRSEKVLKEYGIKSWKVLKKESLTSRCSIGKNNSVLIRPDIFISETEIQKLLVHEIETHVLTAVNGQEQPYEVFARGLSRYLETQEGLAIYNQESVFPLKSNLNIILGTLMAHMALKKSFRELFNFAKKYTDNLDGAWLLALKAKRGMVDTDKPGGFTKNYLYLQGYQKVKKFLKDGGSYDDLYLGKINIDQLSIIKKIPDIKEPKHIPSFTTV